MGQAKEKNPKNNNSIRNHKGVFSNSLDYRQRCFADYAELAPVIKLVKALGLKIVLTQGTFDMLHIGHARYLEEAKGHGDFLVVGVDSDEKVKARKGPERPVVPEAERLEMVSHMKPVDAVVIKPLKAIKWELTKLIKPDALVATADTYTPEELKDLKNYCGKVVVLKPFATTSTSAKIRLLQIGIALKLEKIMVPKLLIAVKDSLNEIKGK